jgi:hypothetical protein
VAGLEYWQGDLGAAGRHWVEARSIFRALGDPGGEAYAVYSLAFLAAIRDDDRAYQELTEESIRLFGEAGDRHQAAVAKNHILLFAVRHRDWERAVSLGHELLDEFRALGERFGVANALDILALGHAEAARYAEARRLWAEAVDIYRELGDVSGQAKALGGLAIIPVFEDDAERAVRLGGATSAAEESIRAEAPISLRPSKDPRHLVRGTLTDERIAELWEEGRRMELDTAIEEAIRGPARGPA